MSGKLRKLRGHDALNTRSNFFYASVSLPDDNGCMIWLSSKNKAGYGQMNIGGEAVMLAHRVSYQMHFQNFNEELCVLHKCDNPPCVAPDHLFIGTRKDNMADCAAKKRVVIPIIKGQDMHNAKLLNCEIPIIRKKFKQGLSARYLANFYSVSVDTIRTVINKKHWSHIA